MAIEVSALEPVTTEPVASKYRRITTPIPVPESLETLQRLRDVEPLSMQGMPPVIWHQAQGFQIRDPYGNQWIDLTSGIVMANSGHAHPRILQAIRDQADSRLLFTYAFPTSQRQQVLERLAGLVPGLSKAILFSSGTEATECAISLMRKHGLKQSPSKIGIVSIEGCYHGRTLAAKAAGGAPGLVDGLDRAALAHYQLPVAGPLTVRGLDPERIAGVILESIPGWSTTLYPQPFIDELTAWAERHKILLACDEVQCGMGRTGRMFAFEHYGIVPDLIACGKGLSSSLPASAVIGRSSILDLAAPGEMSSTFGGNPMCAAAVLANLDVIRDEGLVERSARLGERLGVALGRIVARHRPFVARANGRGLFHSLHLHDPDTHQPLTALCDEVAMEAVRRGVMMFVTGRGMIKFSPPLIIAEDALDEAAAVVGEIVDSKLTSRAAAG